MPIIVESMVLSTGYTTDTDGLANLNGITFEVVLPVVALHFYAAVRGIPRDGTIQVHLAKFVNEGPVRVASTDVPVAADPAPHGRNRVLVSLDQVEFAGPGRYAIDLWYNDQQIGRFPFTVELQEARWHAPR